LESLPWQHEQSQVFVSPAAVGTTGVTLSADCPFVFIGQLSPLQQSQLSQQDLASIDTLSLSFIGQESPLQQQQDIACVPERVLAYANAAKLIPRTIMAAMIRSNFFFILFLVI